MNVPQYPTAETILVTGGTGTVGRALVDELLTRPGLHIRVLTRRSDAVLPAGVEVHVGDFDRLDDATIGCRRVFMLTAGMRIAAHDQAIVRSAVRAGVQHLVKLSALGVGRGGTDPITVAHREGENTLRASGLAWTVLRPTGFMSNALEWAYSIKATGVVAAPFPDGRTAVVDPADVARVAAAALTEAGHHGQVYELTGPEPLTPPEQVRVLADVLGRPVTYAAEEPDVTRRKLAQYGMPADLAAAVVDLLASAAEPWNARPLPTVQQVTGRAPTTFRVWAERYRTAFVNAG